jgi:lysophospholipase L1-like esterase
MIYGDSNTHGYNAVDASRFDETIRWTGVCQSILGDDYVIVEEGLNGRNTCYNVPDMEFKNGLSTIIPITLSQLPLDVICVKLGSNDIDKFSKHTPEQIAADAARVLMLAKYTAEEKYPFHPRKYVLMAPLELTQEALTGEFAEFYDEECIEIAKQLPAAYEAMAKKLGFMYFDANKYAKCGLPDGVHLDAENHVDLGKAFAAWVQENL